MSPLTLSLKFTLSVVEGKGVLTPYTSCLLQAGHSPATLFSVILVLDTGIQERGVERDECPPDTKTYLSEWAQGGCLSETGHRGRGVLEMENLGSLLKLTHPYY